MESEKPVNDRFSQFNIESSLCFPKDIFYAPTFDVDAFLSHFKREYSLDRLRDDLKVFLKVLEMSMCELINKDYPDFVNLSTNLVDLEKEIKNLKTPLETIKNEVTNVQTSLDDEIESVMSKLKEKLVIEKRRIVIKLLINWQRSFKVTNEMIGNSDSSGESKKITGDHLERLAFEFCQLKTSLSICSGENNDAITQNNDITKLSEMLEKIMKELFLSCFNLKDLGESQASSIFSNFSLEETKKQMKHVLKSYSLLSKQKLAEQLYADYVVKPFMDQSINETRLESNIHGLKGILDTILEFIDSSHDFLTLANQIKSSTSSQEAEQNEFDFVLNSIFNNFVATVDLNLHYIFSSADPDQFHSNFTSSLEFINAFEAKCLQYDREVKKKLVNSQTYKYFIKKWPVNVYYQIRYQEIVLRFEQDLIDCARSGQEDEDGFYLNATESLLKQMEYCWLESKCFLKCLLGQFWKLNLQLISRYCTYFTQFFKNKLVSDEGASQDPQSFQPKENSEFSLCVMLISDVDKLNQKLPNFFDGVIAPAMRSSNATKEITMLKDAFNISVNSLNQLSAYLIDYMVQTLTEKCNNHLKNATDIPRLYRRTNREVPKTASGYVSLTVNVVSDFKEAYSSESRQREAIERCIQSTIDAVCFRFQTIANDLLESVRKMEDSLRKLQRVRKTATLTTTSSSVSDDDKIRIQLYLDVCELGRMCEERFDGYNGGASYESLYKLVEEFRPSLISESTASTADSGM